MTGVFTDLWNSALPVPSLSQIQELDTVSIRSVFRNDPEMDGYHFLHGVTITSHRNELIATWANNKGAENTQSEVVRWSISTDDGVSWSAPQIAVQAEEGTGASHGAVLSVNGEVWGFFPHFKGLREHVRTFAYRLEANQWREISCIADAPFWPLNEPILLENGDWIMPGVWVGGAWGAKNNTAAVALTHGDFSKWRIVALPKPADLVMWGECGILQQENSLVCLSRCWHDRPVALYSISRDNGKTWTELAASNLPMTDSKPCVGNLRDGRGYLIGSTTLDGGTARYPLTIALASQGGLPFSAIRSIRRGGPNEQTGKRMTLSYPYACEANGKLYVAYSAAWIGERIHNDSNSAELAVIPLSALSVQ